MKRLALLLCAGLLVACGDDAKESGDPTGKVPAPPATGIGELAAIKA